MNKRGGRRSPSASRAAASTRAPGRADRVSLRSAHRPAGDSGRPGHRSRREIAALFLKDTVDAATAHTVQKKDLRLSRRLPGAAEAVPGGVRPPVGGAEPPSRHRSRNREALEGQGGAAQRTALCGAPESGGLPGSRPPVHREMPPATEAAGPVQEAGLDACVVPDTCIACVLWLWRRFDIVGAVHHQPLHDFNGVLLVSVRVGLRGL